MSQLPNGNEELTPTTLNAWAVLSTVRAVVVGPPEDTMTCSGSSPSLRRKRITCGVRAFCPRFRLCPAVNPAGIAGGGSPRTSRRGAEVLFGRTVLSRNDDNPDEQIVRRVADDDTEAHTASRELSPFVELIIRESRASTRLLAPTEHGRSMHVPCKDDFAGSTPAVGLSRTVTPV